MTLTRTLALSCAVALLCAASFVFAQAEESTTTPRERFGERMEARQEQREELREQIDERKAELASTTEEATEEFKERLEEHKASLAKRIQDRVYNLLQNIVGRMSAAVERLTNIADRIDSRAMKLEGGGLVIGGVSEHTNAAREKLRMASDILKSDLGAFIQADRPGERFKEAREKIRTAHDNIRGAREELRIALDILKSAAGIPGAGGVPDVPSVASSTEEASTTNP